MDYRLYLFGPGNNGRPMAHIVALEDEDEPEAIRTADRRRKGGYAELWRRGNLVKVFEADRGFTPR